MASGGAVARAVCVGRRCDWRACLAFEGASAALGMWPWKMRRRMPGASAESGLTLILGSSALPVAE